MEKKDTSYPMANSSYSFNLIYSSGGYVCVAIKDPTAATAASTGTFLAQPVIEQPSQDDPITIVAATNATPIVVSSTTNTLSDGDAVYVSGGLVNTGINGTFTVSSTSGTGFTLLGSRGTGTYTASSAKFVKLPKAKQPIVAAQKALAAMLNDRATNG
jgi:hypothetical protein